MFLFCFYFFSIFCFFFFFKPKLFYQYLFESLQKEQLRGILLNIYIFNLIILNNALLATFINNQETFQRGPKVVFGVIWRCDVGQSQINIETTLKFTNVQQHQINVVYFNTDFNNVRQRQSNAVSFNVEFHNVDQHWNNVKMTIFKKLKRAKKNFELQKKDDSIN